MNALLGISVDRFGLLLGAGASVAAGLPDWDAFAQRLLVGSGVAVDEPEAQAFLARQDAMLAAEAARAATSDWSALLRSALYGDDEEPEPAVLHLAAAALAAQRPPRAVQLHTLNFDPLLGSALRAALVELTSDAQVHERAESAQGPEGSYVVNHLHGLLRADPTVEAQGIVLTLNDFVELSGRSHPWQVAALQDSLQKGPLILAGTSYRDPDIRQWMYELQHDHDHEVVVLLARQGLDLDRRTFERVRSALEDQWRAVGVTPVVLQDHADAAQALRELPDLHRSDYLPPRQRARNVWAQQLSAFTDRQRDHSAQLQADLERLKGPLGPELNLTLWLADGEGQLVRWAAPDRVYNDPDRLRRTVPGYDSPWIAGQCLGRDDPLARDLIGPRGPTQRWQAVVAVPIPVQVAGGPAFSSAVLSSASPQTLATHDVDEWQATLIELAQEWGATLSAP